MILSTGAQGESNAGLMKIINGEHRSIKIKPGDTFVLSSSVIPGNERSVQTVKDNLARQGAIVYHSALVDIHSSGHAPKDDIDARHQAAQAEIPRCQCTATTSCAPRTARPRSTPASRKKMCVLMDNGQVAELTKDSLRSRRKKCPPTT